MKTSHQLVLLCSIALFFHSCTSSDHDILPNQSVTYVSPQEKLNKMAPPLVLFQYAFTDINTGVEQGWIIDREGIVKSYNTKHWSDWSPSQSNETWKEEQVINLYAISTNEIGRIDINELQNRAHQGYGLSKKFLTHTQLDEKANYQMGFYAFSPKEAPGYIHKTRNGCDYGTPNYNPVTGSTGDTQVLRQIVHVSGYFNRYETSTYATDLYQWLYMKNEEL